MVKLTPELLAQAPSALNPVKERQLDLRGYKIPTIENLGVTKDQHDAIDFTDNSITVLGNLPLLKRLRTLLLANNRVASISPSIHLSVPNLTTLVLTGNSIVELGDLEPLKEIKGLKYLALLGNPVREKKWYREWLAWRIASLRVLDFQRIRDKEREAGKSLFLTAEGLPTALATTISTTISKQGSKAAVTLDEPKPAALSGKAGRLMSKEDAEKVKLAIAKATSIEEIRRLERSLREGYMPSMESVGA
ncbi:L domain-like protein [Suillus fuscotomentosus]|uniref:U2 small nuclear ribonucleoprotein A' n=1 Tax=Suillus fuscotomentosus TaxID=1912939 RepID=A0AAD4HFS2_9AGAM|nr:L domain-like protein [Suillus fuscotomentosus]KAG1834532.1 L domain-like protein [Suillus variegatus]KAG1866285.1 leucine-rich repeat-domain-containing protein [Suillus tomentosus]KAG1894882.1 L domain-like protein [Suillus fuscotomentosus]KAG2062081.1 L domain-like protein [Suillus hirtellus]